MLAATTSPWYLPTWVSGQMPVTSPIAHRRSPARRCASTGMPCGVGLDADGLQADALDARAPAGGDEQAVAAQLAAVVELEDVLVAVAPRAGRVRAEDELDAVAAQDLAERLAQRRGLAREHVLGALDERPPRRRSGARPAPSRCPTGPPPRTSSRRGTAFMPVDLAVRPDAVELAQARDRRDDRVGAVGEDDVLGGVAHAVDLDHARCRRAGRCRAAGRCRCRPASAPGRASE